MNQLEVRAEGEEFEECMVNGMPLNISIYDPERAEEERKERSKREEEERGGG